LPKAPSLLPSKKKKIPEPQKTYNRIMLDNKRRIGERKSQVCLFHYPHDKVLPQKKDKVPNVISLQIVAAILKLI
jgi:hypothetical protein